MTAHNPQARVHFHLQSDFDTPAPQREPATVDEPISRDTTASVHAWFRPRPILPTSRGRMGVRAVRMVLFALLIMGLLALMLFVGARISRRLIVPPEGRAAGCTPARLIKNPLTPAQVDGVQRASSCPINVGRRSWA